jgi:hypothetical protein
MKVRKALLLIGVIVLLIGFSGSQRAAAEPGVPEISEACKAEIRLVLETCKQQCGKDLRCFIRCTITNFPACLR